MTTVRRFWIEFDPQECSDARFRQGVGVTGFDVRDCLSMVADLVPDGLLPPVHRITVDISLAEPLPVNPRHLGVPVWRGVWYPPVNLETGPTLSIDRRGAPCDYPTPVTQSPPRRASETMRTKATWWDEIPHIDGLLWPPVIMHRAEYGRGMRLSAPALRDVCATDSTYGDMVREALDFMIAWRPTPDEWFDPTETRFADQRDLDEYLRAFRAYLFGTRPEPIYPPGSEPLSPEDAWLEAIGRLVVTRPGPIDAPGSERLSPDAQPRLPEDA
ncbi:hypothetical protein [Nocardia sp. NBC_01009]|uniref:hypothetical protein n=1 Tax=Nocardia sp. NBC_01009 TaxID=2975996 RepID=UPI00386D400B|nr:hypothetical protein OHA42_02490 [Nocardia sp. NBC_01009]